jgi:alkaline phosphatase D
MDTRLDRRRFLALAASAAAMAAAPALARQRARKSRWPKAAVAQARFPQGVASGDPDDSSVILWTRCEPAGRDAVPLTVEVATDDAFEHVIAEERVVAEPACDWTVRVLVGGLRAAGEYFYRFIDADGATSRIGRTLTAPRARDGRAAKFAFVSCQDVTNGAMNAWRRMAWEDERARPEDRLSFVLHLGDFIYEVVWYPEDSPGGVKRGRRLRDVFRYAHGEKMHDFHLPTTLDDYRTCYRAYLRDEDLQAARARWPFVPVWDNHEFSWQAYQSQQVFDGKVRPAQKLKVIANQAWFEFQPARVVQPSHAGLDRFVAPNVENVALEEFDELGTGLEPNNLAAIRSLRIHRQLRWGRHVDLILTDNRSFMSTSAIDGSAFVTKGFPWMFPEDAGEMLDRGRTDNGGNPRATIRFDGKDVPNPATKERPQSYLGVEQKRWLLERLKASQATWKVWGHSFGTMVWRADPQNLPPELGMKWPGSGYALMNGGHFHDHDEIFDFVRANAITGLAVVAGDRHTFWAGHLTKSVAAGKYDPVGVEFITGAISQQNLAEVAEQSIKDDLKLKPLYVLDTPEGRNGRILNMTMLHGVRSALAYAKDRDLAAAKRLSNPELSPHLEFADVGGYGYAVVTAGANALETEFVCIPPPLERSATPDGGPLVYRVRHRVARWQPGEKPQLTRTFAEGDIGLCT